MTLTAMHKKYFDELFDLLTKAKSANKKVDISILKVGNDLNGLSMMVFYKDSNKKNVNILGVEFLSNGKVKLYFDGTTGMQKEFLLSEFAGNGLYTKLAEYIKNFNLNLDSKDKHKIQYELLGL